MSADGAQSLLSTLVNAYAGALINVSQTVGIEAMFLKESIAVGVNAPGSRVAALIGIVGSGIQGTAALMADETAFGVYVNAFSGGMINSNPDDPMALSVLGELTNMISGQALIKANISGLDITPPQLISGENIKTIPPRKQNVKTFTLPFKVDSGKVYLILSTFAS